MMYAYAAILLFASQIIMFGFGAFMSATIDDQNSAKDRKIAKRCSIALLLIAPALAFIAGRIWP